MIDYKIANNKGYRYLFIIFDSFSKFVWAIHLKITISKTITQQFSKILTSSKHSPIKLEIDRPSEWYNSIFQSFLKGKNIQLFQITQMKDLV